MRNQTVVPGVCIVMLVAALFAVGCTSVFPGGKATPTPAPTPVPTTGPAVTPGGSSCGLTSCPGLDLACGTNPPQMCTEEYRIGDKCRKYARCDTTGGSCTLAIEPKFTQCKACSEQCQIQAGADGLAALTCEEKC